MKPMNFPARKLARQLRADAVAGREDIEKMLIEARAIRTKKIRKGKVA